MCQAEHRIRFRTPKVINSPERSAASDRAISTEVTASIVDARLRGLLYYNAGYYWEAHEAWEAAWVIAGRQGPTADFYKGLIKLAAAGVKLYEGNLPE